MRLYFFLGLLLGASVLFGQSNTVTQELLTVNVEYDPGRIIIHVANDREKRTYRYFDQNRMGDRFMRDVRRNPERWQPVNMTGQPDQRWELAIVESFLEQGWEILDQSFSFGMGGGDSEYFRFVLREYRTSYLLGRPRKTQEQEVVQQEFLIDLNQDGSEERISIVQLPGQQQADGIPRYLKVETQDGMGWYTLLEAHDAILPLPVGEDQVDPLTDFAVSTGRVEYSHQLADSTQSKWQHTFLWTNGTFELARVEINQLVRGKNCWFTSNAEYVLRTNWLQGTYQGTDCDRVTDVQPREVKEARNPEKPIYLSQFQIGQNELKFDAVRGVILTY